MAMKRKLKTKSPKATGAKRTGWSVASAAGKLLAELKKGRQVWLVGPGRLFKQDITDTAERIFASALGQREVRSKVRK